MDNNIHNENTDSTDKKAQSDESLEKLRNALENIDSVERILSLSENVDKILALLEAESNELKPISVSEAIDKYFSERREDASVESRRTIKAALDSFERWADENGLDNMNNISGRKLNDLKTWQKENTEENIVSLNGTMYNIRRFMVFCVGIEAVEPDIPKKVPIPPIPDDEDVSDEKPSDELVENVSAYLVEYEGPTVRHVLYVLIKETGIRVGACRAIDIRDVDLEDQTIKLRHRPCPDKPDTKGTPLKNKKDGQRSVNLSNDLTALIKAYLNNPDRNDVIDKYGRKPLLTSNVGRPRVGTLRRWLYQLTRPCTFSNTCPHDRNIETCDATGYDLASDCPSSHSPHPLRRWSIERQIDDGVPKERLTSRCDVSIDVLNKHYDTRKEERKQKSRRAVLKQVYDNYGDEEESDTTSVEPSSPSSTKTNGQSKPGQKEIDEFGDVNIVAQPSVIPVIGVVEMSRWMPHRLQRELQDMTPRTESSPYPSAARGAKAIGAYWIFVLLVAINFTLLGFVPV